MLILSIGFYASSLKEQRISLRWGSSEDTNNLRWRSNLNLNYSLKCEKNRRLFRHKHEGIKQIEKQLLYDQVENNFPRAWAQL